MTKDEMIAIARELVEAEDNLNARLAAFNVAINTNGVTKTAGRAAVAEVLDRAETIAPRMARVNGHSGPFATRLREMLESRPNVRMSIEQIREFFPEAKPLTVRKTLFYLTHNVKGFKRDKRQRGVYYFSV